MPRRNKRSAPLYERVLICPKCGFKNHIWAKSFRIRPEGHIKTMYCQSCGELVDMIETRDPKLR